MEKNAEKSPARASDAESRRLSKPGKRAVLTRWLHSNERRVRQSRQQTDDQKWLIEKPEQPLVFIALMETGISNSWERYLLFSFRGLGFSLKSIQGVTSRKHVLPVVLRCTCRLYSPALHPVPWGCSLELGLGFAVVLPSTSSCSPTSPATRPRTRGNMRGNLPADRGRRRSAGTVPEGRWAGRIMESRSRRLGERKINLQKAPMDFWYL